MIGFALELKSILSRKVLYYQIRPMSSTCIFCNIITGNAPSEKCYQNDELIVFKDIKPASKFHLLAVPLQHIPNINSLEKDHIPLVEKLIENGKNALKELGGDINDIRIGFHSPPFNSVSHLHLHLISPASEMSFKNGMIFRPGSWWFKTVDDVLNNLRNKPQVV